MSKHSLLTNRLLMAQGAIALLQKNIDLSLTYSKEYDRMQDTEEGERDTDVPINYDEFNDLQLELPF